jgi:hydrogenase maturation protease
MRNNFPRILVYGYGNPGRQDDALGILLAEAIDIWAGENGISRLETDQNYQLNIEDADKIAHYDLVIFADASVEDIDSFQIDEVVPDTKTDFTMHSVTPSFVVGLCHEVFTKKIKVYQLQIKGYEWEFMSSISKNAENNLASAITFLKEFILKKIHSEN